MRLRTLSAVVVAALLGVADPAVHAADGAPAAIDPQADAILKKTCENLKSKQSAVFRLSDTIDEVQPDGTKLQFAHLRSFTFVRPAKLKVEIEGDVSNRTFWKDGKTITVFDRDRNAYAQVPDPGSIDQALDLLQEKYSMSMPGADLLSADPYKHLTQDCSRIDYVGEGLVGDEKCEHLSFVRDTIDWQLWVTKGDKPGPRQLVITYKLLPGEPQYTLRLLDRGDASKIADADFTAVIPKDAKKIQIRGPQSLVPAPPKP